MARHESPSSIGGISVEGTQAQTISGNNAVFGNIVMNNSNGANVVNNIRINGHLNFSAGSLYINDYLLTFGENAVVGGSPGRKQMVMLNGVLSDQGVRKLYAAGAAGEFVFPIGVQGKYTPAAYTFLANEAPGSITLRTINEKHAAVSDVVDNELAYYWSVKAEGFSGLSVRHRYTYDQDDVRADEAQYVGGRYDYENYTWYNLDEVDAANNTISVTGDYITGEYTAGYAPNFVTKPVFYSRGNGDWDDPTTWATTPGGAASGHTPDGNPVVIAEGHLVTLNVDNAYTYSVELNGTLDIGTTLYHNMGHFFGNGTLAVGSTSDGNFILPGGRFDDFFDNAASTLEFKGDNEANLPLKPGNIYKPFQNVVLSGSGPKNISAEDMKINGSLIIRNGTVFSNANNNRTIYVGGDWINENTSGGGFLAGRGTVVFDGNRTQQFKVLAAESFYNVTMNASGELDLAETAVGAAFVASNRLNLSRGIIRSYDNKVVYISNTANNAVSGGNVNSFVDGPMTKRMLTGQSFTFQVGNEGRYGRMAILNTQGGSSPADWTVRYLNANDLPKEEENLNSPITSVSNNERWEVSRPSGASANIQLRWDEQSYPGVTSDALLRNRLRVVQFNSTDSKWSERGQNVNATAKMVATSTRVTTNDYVFTLGLSGVTATISDFTPVEICNNGAVASIPVVLSGSAPWTLSYRVTGASSTRNFTQTGITSPNYVIQLTGDDLAGAGNYSVSLVSVSDQSAIGIANGGAVNLLVQETSVPVISGAATATNITFGNNTGTYQLQLTETTAATGCEVTTVFTVEVTNIPVPDIAPDEPNICAGTTVTYSTAAITGNQYKWTVTGGTVQTSGAGNWRTVAGGGNSVTVLWGAAGNGNVIVEERVGTTSVQGETNLDVVVSPPVNSRTVSMEDTEVCDGSSTFVRVVNSELNVSYRLKNSATGTYMGPSIGGDGSDLLLPTGDLFATDAPYQIVVEAFNLACSIDILAGTVQVLPAVEVALSSDVAGNAFCMSTAVNFSASPGFSQYTFVVDGQPFDNGNQAVFTTNALVDGSEVSVQALAANGCWGESETLTMQAANIAGMWTGVADSDWNNSMNWCNGQVPVSNSNLVISSKMVHEPIVTGDVTLTNLTIEEDASLMLDGGSRVDLAGTFLNDGELVLNNSYHQDGLVSLKQEGSILGSGLTRVKLTLPVDKWYYVSHPIKEAKTGIYD
ncbi:MAG: hypothetical protein LC643_00470, partial [Bacteroidales bacterium]|nr:hypothetical protein [Bacteroidales bacterium]